MGSIRGSSRTSGALAMVLVLAVAVGVWLIQGRDPGTSTVVPDDQGTSVSDPSSDPSTQQPASPSSVPEIDELSSLPTVALADLPPEASDTIDLIDAGGPYPYRQDGGTFGNREGLLPEFEYGYYREFTVVTPGSDDRGARRIIEGGDGELYWTDDHYASFRAIYL